VSAPMLQPRHFNDAVKPARQAAFNTSNPAQACDKAPARLSSDTRTVRTALCVEIRDPRRANGPIALEDAQTDADLQGVLYVFMPPLARLEDYLNLLCAVEKTAQQLQMKIVLEGYPAPRDPRLKLLQVTPDPGVIEVNIHPASNWQEVVQHT